MSLQFLLLLFLTCSFQCFAAICSDKQYIKNDRCCQKCPPGQYLSTECSGENETICSFCQDGEYQDKWNMEPYCHLHDYCDQNAGLEQEREGTTEKNVLCKCQRGRHCSSQSCETCVLNTLCPPGYGVIQKADKFSDSVCSLCANGTFSNVSSDTEQCKEWSRCSQSQEVETPGSSVRDVLCRQRFGSNAVINVLLPILILLFVAVFLYFFSKWVLRRRMKNKENEKQEQNLMQDIQHQDPVEDQDPALDITLQGHPVAQEQGKDSRMSQEEA